MKYHVYVETSVISYLTGRQSRDLIVAAHQEITRQWWQGRSNALELFVSDIVMEEARQGDPDAALTRLEGMSTLPVLLTDDRAVAVSRKLVLAEIVPYAAVADALHIAVAATNGMDYLLTWNCRHLANALMRNRIVMFIESEGYACPVICTPEELQESQA